MKKRWRARLKGQRGQSLVEMAVLVPFLLIILLGIIDLGRVYFAYESVANATREAARYGSLHQLASEAELTAKIVNETGGTLDFGPGNNLLTVTRSSPAITDKVTVNTNYIFTTFFIGPFTEFVSGWWGGPTVPRQMPIHVSVTMPVATGPTAAEISAATATAAAAASQTAQAAVYETSVAVATQTAAPLATQTAQAQIATATAAAAATQTAIASGAPTSNATATSTPTATNTATATSTATPTNTSTPTATPTTIPLILNPIMGGDTSVTGRGEPGVYVEVRDYSVWGAPVIGGGIINAAGNFNIPISPAIVGHYIVATASNGSVDAKTVASGTPTVTPTVTNTPTATPTNTSTPTPTPPTPVACTSTNIEVTVYQSGHNKGSGVTVQLLYAGSVVAQASTDASGKVNFTAANGQPLQGNRSYVVRTVNEPVNNWNSGYVFCNSGLSLDINLDLNTPTATVTSTAPGAPVLYSATCSVQGGRSYHDLSWSAVTGAASYNIYRSADGGATYSWLINTASTSASLAVDANSIYLYYVTAVNAQFKEGYRSNFQMGVCGNTPTPTLTPTPTSTTQPSATATPTTTPIPDLVFSSGLSTSPPSGSIAAYQPVEIRITVKNQGTLNIDSLFWVDLYVDDTPDIGKSGAAWQGVSGLNAGASVQVTMTYTFNAPGTYTLLALVDSFNDVTESNEGNNLSGSLVVVVGDGNAPTPTATRTPAGTPTLGPSPTVATPGSISGWTWIYYNGNWTVPTGRVVVSVYQSNILIATTIADNNGFYRLADVPPGQNYTVFAETIVDNEHYTDTRTNVNVDSGRETENVNLVLFPYGV